MKYVLIPIKESSNAKQRLAGLMSPEERSALAGQMLEHVLTQVSRAGGYDRAAVVTLSPSGIELAQRLGFEIIREAEQVSESVSVDYGSGIVRGKGARSVLRLPIDLPLLLAEDVETVLARLDHRSGVPVAVIVPSRDGTGTNALGRTPPELFQSRFGPGSYRLHRAEARRCGAVWLELNLPRIACDIDDPGDIAYLLEHGRGTRIHEFLMDLGIGRRLGEAVQPRADCRGGSDR